MCDHLTRESYRTVLSWDTVLFVLYAVQGGSSLWKKLLCVKAINLLFIHVVLFIMPYKTVYDFLKFVDEILLSV